MQALSPLATKPETVTDAVYDRIHQAIVTRALEPGARITEARLAAELNVSKTPVREALLRLREIGLIEADGGRGNRVVTSTTQTLRDAYEMRAVLEVFAARTAAERGSDELTAQVAAAAERSAQAAETRSFGRFRKPDLEFHRAIAAAAGNARVARALDDVGALIRALRQRDRPEAKAVIAFGEAHRRIAAAIVQHDPDAAAEAMRGHLEHVEQLLSTDESG